MKQAFSGLFLPSDMVHIVADTYFHDFNDLDATEAHVNDFICSKCYCPRYAEGVHTSIFT